MTGGRSARTRALRIAHHHPGRIRARADAFLRSENAAGAVRLALEPIEGITSVRHNAGTGSMLVEYDPTRAEANEILARMATAAGLDAIVDGDEDEPVDFPRATMDGARAVDRAVIEVTGGRTDLRGIVSATLVGASIFSFFTLKPRLPRWDNLLWWSYALLNERAKGEKPEEPSE